MNTTTLNSGPTLAEHDLIKRIAELLSREEVLAIQHSRIQWLKESDRNMSFFHAKARERARQNKISSLKRDDGIVCNNQ